MPDDPRLRAIIEELLETGASPDDVCRDCPELLNEVRVRLRRLRQVESQIDALFPPFERTHVSEGRFDISAEERTPEVPGYRIEGVLGRGGVGLVYKAQHLKLNRPVALKMPLSGRLASPKERARFRQEAEAVASLRHTNIVHIYDVGEVEGRPYFTMEFMDGGDLAERIAGRPQSAREAATIVETLADVVSVAHDAGIVHRDLKPANVLLCSDGVLKVSDFGLARRLESAEGLTIDGHGVGTPSYMAPEQASGLAVGFCPSVDIYALGAMLYELLTGRPPFHGASAAETLRRILDDDPVPPSRIVAYAPRDLETICLKCLQKDPNQRYASAGEVRDDLSAFLAGRPIAARPSSRAERVVRWIRRNRAMSGLIGVTIALGVVASVAALREWKLAAQQRAEMTRWKERLEFVIELENEGRFDEVRAILGRVPDAGSEALRREIERAESDLNLVERLDRIRMSRGASFAGGGIDYDECARNYAAAFRESGLGSVDHPADPTADRIAASAVQATIIAALDDWAACAQARDRSWILDVARRVDPDPWRDRVRSQTDWADLDTLAELAETADVDRQPVTIMVAMSTRWRRLGGDPTAFLRRVYRRCPDDFWLNFELGLLLEQVNLEEAIGHCRAALALRPDAAIVHYNMGVYLQRLKRDDEAEFHFRQTVKADPAHVWAQLSLAAMAYNKRDWGDALDRFRVVLDIDPDNEQGWRGEQYCMIRLNRADEVQRAWQSRLAQSPTSHETWDGYAELCLYLGNEGEYRRACDELLTRFATATDPHIRERSGRACMFGELSPEKTK
ncbi:MAG TPA: serine/threonine-protein kinase, partial [Phycisphaerae bacterium]|nr:serine/threonine-protein kinase [Phycisphaerae bacterium]